MKSNHYTFFRQTMSSIPAVDDAPGQRKERHDKQRQGSEAGRESTSHNSAGRKSTDLKHYMSCDTINFY